MQRSGMATGESSSGVIAGGARSVVMRNGSVRRDGRVVWEGINLDVHPGEFVAVLGPNGVGKSTLIKVLLGLLPLAGGEVRVLGRARRTLSARWATFRSAERSSPGSASAGSILFAWGWTATDGGFRYPSQADGAHPSAPPPSASTGPSSSLEQQRSRIDRSAKCPAANSRGC